MRLTESELRRLIVEELEDLQELDIIDESYLDEGLKETALATIAAFLMATYGINDAQAKKLSNKVPSHKAPAIAQKIQKGSNQEAKAELVKSGIDVNKLAPATQDVSLKDKPQQIPGFNTGYSPLDDIQNQQDENVLAQKLYDFLMSQMQDKNNPKAQLMKNYLAKKNITISNNPAKIEYMQNMIRDLGLSAPSDLTAVHENKITKNLLLQLIKEEIESLDEVGLKGAAAGAMLGLSALGGGKAVADPNPEAPVLVSKMTKENNAMEIILHLDKIKKANKIASLNMEISRIEPEALRKACIDIIKELLKKLEDASLSLDGSAETRIIDEVIAKNGQKYFTVVNRLKTILTSIK